MIEQKFVVAMTIVMFTGMVNAVNENDRVEEEPIKVAVLDSWGADYAIYTIYPTLNNEWQSYGSIPIIIDYTTLNKDDIT